MIPGARALPRVLLIDRYILRQVIGWQAIVVGVVMFLLCVETTPRLLVQIAGIREAPSVLARSLASLMPEYIAIALPIGLFLGTALTFRRLARAGELDVFAASGIGNGRLLMGPAALGLLTCALLVGLRGYVQPAGERELDSIGMAVRTGQFGYSIQPGVSHRLGRDSQLYFARIDGASGRVEDVVLHHRHMVAMANRATLDLSADDHVVVALNDVTAIWGSQSGEPRVLRFRALRLAIPVSERQRPPRQPPRERLDRFSLGQLLDFDPTRDGSAEIDVAMAHASVSARAAAAILCCILPLFGFVHGVPPKRSLAAIGLGVGIIEIILFWRLSALIEDRLAPVAPAAHAFLVVFYALVAFQMMRFQQRAGLGAVEQALIHVMRYGYRGVMVVFGRRKAVN
ncbi:LptF/LptG family permease [Allosphingosinicella deserti]|uniref:LptF/LptG family permease n=1 Tax=Allosphingosinicella deserti TaxID=2116704 RepID=UPI001304F4BF|nr:LptF/LptG family permease [Sphingomonas deserti]